MSWLKGPQVNALVVKEGNARKKHTRPVYALERDKPRQTWCPYTNTFMTRSWRCTSVQRTCTKNTTSVTLIRACAEKCCRASHTPHGYAPSTRSTSAIADSASHSTTTVNIIGRDLSFLPGRAYFGPRPSLQLALRQSRGEEKRAIAQGEEESTRSTGCERHR